MGCSGSKSSHSKDKRKFKKGTISQWVKTVTQFSSQYDNTGWGAHHVEGPPAVYPDYGDRSGAWAPGDIDKNQFLELKYEEAVYIAGIDIYETFHAGGVTAIKARDDDGDWKTLWKTDKPTVIKSSRVFSPKLDLKDFKCKTKEIRLEIDCTACGTWVEIDAVELHGRKYAVVDMTYYYHNKKFWSSDWKKPKGKGDSTQWVARVTQFSSEYDSSGWSANAVTGSPTTYPSYGDNKGTWAQADLDNKQFIEVEYNNAVYVKGIDIYETYHAGGVTAIKGLDTEGDWLTLWTTSKPDVIESSRIFSPKLDVKKLNCSTKNIRIEVDCTGCGSWVEIDAIQLRGCSSQPSNDSDSSDSD